MKEVQRRAVSRNRLSQKVRTRLLPCGWISVACANGRWRRSVRSSGVLTVITVARPRVGDDGARHPGRLQLDQHGRGGARSSSAARKWLLGQCRAISSISRRRIGVGAAHAGSGTRLSGPERRGRLLELGARSWRALCQKIDWILSVAHWASYFPSLSAHLSATFEDLGLGDAVWRNLCPKRG